MKSVWLNGIRHLLDDYSKDIRRINPLPTFEKEVISFLLEWGSGKDTFNLQSSGSTGEPKSIALYREQMIASAEATLDYLNISSGSKTLLCLDPRYIAGKMVIVRSLIGNLELYGYTPTANPLSENKIEHAIDLASFVPYQIVDIVKNLHSFSNFQKIKNVIIGGAGISPELEGRLKFLNNKIYHSFGMTETVSHIALRHISGKDNSQYFKVLPGIEIGTDNRGCLKVKGKITRGDTIVTNDLVQIKSDTEFIWKGRFDHIINSGGIKININSLENKIRKILGSMDFKNNFFIDHIPDEKLGEKIVMILESGDSNIDLEPMKSVLKKQLTKFEIPKKIYIVKKFSLTDSGKIARKKIVKQITEQ